LIHRPATLGSIAAAALAVAAIAAPAGALGAGGTAKIALNGPAAEAMRAQGVRIAPVAPARAKGTQVSLPVAAGLAGTKTSLIRYRGGLRFGAGKARVRLTGLSLRLAKRSTLEAKLAGEKLPLFRVGSGKREIDAGNGAVQLTGLPLQLTGAAARAIGKRLGLHLAAGRFGSLSGAAVRLTATAAPTTTGPAAGGSTGSTPAELSGACPLPGAPGPSGESNPPVPAPPLGALSVTGATINWRVRETFIRYIATGEGTSAVEGATAGPALLLPGASVPLSYDFGFPFANGWLHTGADPASPADDRALLNFNGGVRFRYSAHGLDILASKPELELNGAASRAIFSISENGGAPVRQVLVNLDLGRAGGISQSGSTYTYDRVPGSVPSGTASSVFAGFYSPGTDFGCFTVSFSTS
jgi:hypothetical protein